MPLASRLQWAERDGGQRRVAPPPRSADMPPKLDHVVCRLPEIALLARSDEVVDGGLAPRHDGHDVIDVQLDSIARRRATVSAAERVSLARLKGHVYVDELPVDRNWPQISAQAVPVSMSG